MKRAAFDRVGVLGAGIMGSGIACHLANAGVKVVLLDIPPPNGGAPKDAFARNAIQAALKASPKPLFHPSRAALIETGNLADDLGKLASCDWVVEAVKEDLAIKQALFARLEAAIGENTIVSSNTSGIPLKQMVEGRSLSFRKRFSITHFFNPVRYMKLLEIIAGPDTDPAVIARLQAFVEDGLGKGVVFAKDTPNFIANRIGTYGMMRVMKEMEVQSASIEEIDAIFGRPLGRPKSAVFQTGDVVGLDLLCAVAEHCAEGLPNDPERELYHPPAWVKELVKLGQLGRKAKDKGGFYKKEKSGDITVWDHKAKAYRPSQKVRIPSLGEARNIDELADRMKKVTFADDRAGQIAWPVMRDTLAYSAALVGEISDDVRAIDDAMRWGFAWDLGPFEAWDSLGFRVVADRMKAEGKKLAPWIDKLLASGATSILGAIDPPKEDARRLTLAARKKGGTSVIRSNSGATLVDIGDGVAAVEFHTKANAIDADIAEMIVAGIDHAEANGRGLVLYNEGENFSVGANLMLIYMLAQNKDWAQLDKAVQGLQGTVQRMRYAKVPVIAAPHNMALGGGCEFCLATGSAAGLAPIGELYIGLVEVGVGIIPAAGGVMNSVLGAMERIPEGVEADPLAFLGPVFKQIATAAVATSVEEGRAMGYVPAKAIVTMDRRRQLHDAKALVIGLHDAGYRPPLPRSARLPGASGIATLNSVVLSMVQGGYATPHDGKVARTLARVMCGGVSGHVEPVTEQMLLDLEREAFLSLAGEELSQARMASILTTNKPLRN